LVFVSALLAALTRVSVSKRRARRAALSKLRKK